MASEWAGEWSKCDVSCGVGVKRKKRHCVDGVTKDRISDTKCTEFSLKLQLLKTCDEGYCAGNYNY